jgi:hypothetical protein
MHTSINTDVTLEVGAQRLEFEGDQLILYLTDGRAVILPLTHIDWLQWLANATPEQRAKWSIEPGGFAVYWEDLDDGFEVAHALSLQPVA